MCVHLSVPVRLRGRCIYLICFRNYNTSLFLPVIYRDCFDGWIGGVIDYDYNGCKQQVYTDQGQRKHVQWCFCNTIECNNALPESLAK